MNKEISFGQAVAEFVFLAALIYAAVPFALAILAK